MEPCKLTVSSSKVDTSFFVVIERSIVIELPTGQDFGRWGKCLVLRRDLFRVRHKSKTSEQDKLWFENVPSTMLILL